MWKKQSKLLLTKRVSKLSLAMAISLALAACGGDSDDDSENQSTSTTPENVDTNGDDPSGENIPDVDDELPGKITTTPFGNVYAFGANSRTLYVLTNDTKGSSSCNNGCAVTWPPILSTTAQTSGQFETIERNNGDLQWSFKGSPLYYYEGDATEGEANGEGLNSVWYVARPDPVKTAETTLGTILAASGSTNSGGNDPATRFNFDGRTLYTFSGDTATSSNCNNGCANTWPPLYADKGAVAQDGYSLVNRNDGSIQWAYQNQPLYFYQGDSAAGDTTGDGVNGVWFVAKP